MNRGVYSAENEKHWVAMFQASGQSLRNFRSEHPEAPSVTTLSRMVKKVTEGEVAGAGRSRHSRLNPKDIVSIVIWFTEIVRGKLPVTRLARRWSQGIDEPSTTASCQPTTPHIQATANAIRPILDQIKNGRFMLTVLEKQLLEKRARATRYVPSYTGLVWAIDDWSLEDFSLKWKPGSPTDSFCHLVTVASEGDSQIFSVVLTKSQPRAYDYALAARLAITREQHLSNLPASRPIVLVADNCGAATDPEFERFCDGCGVLLHRAKPHSPWEKPGVERAVHSFQARTFIPMKQTRLMYREDLSAPPLTECSAQDFLDAAIQAARRFHETAVGGETFHARYIRSFLNYCLPLSDRQLASIPWTLRDSGRVVNGVISCKNGPSFELPLCPLVPDGQYTIIRRVERRENFAELLVDERTLPVTLLQSGGVLS